MTAREFHGLLGGAVLAIWSDIEKNDRDEFNDWYTNQHLPERIGMPGFLRGRRFENELEEPPRDRYFTLYEVADSAVLTSPEYMERLNNPTDWTRKVGPMFNNSTRTAAVVRSTLGQGIGGFAATFEFGPKAQSRADLEAWLTSEALPAIHNMKDHVGVHWFVADNEVTSAKDSTEENKAVGGEARPQARWVVFVEGTSAHLIAEAERTLSGDDGVTAHGAEADTTFNRYRLVVSLSE